MRRRAELMKRVAVWFRWQSCTTLYFPGAGMAHVYHLVYMLLETDAHIQGLVDAR